MKTKKRFVDIVSPTLKYAEGIDETLIASFGNVLSFILVDDKN